MYRVKDEPKDTWPDLADPTLFGAWLNPQCRSAGDDISPSAADMTDVTGTIVRERVGAAFDGATQYLRRAVANWRSADSLGTVCAWVRRTAAGAAHVIFASDDEATANYRFVLQVLATNVLSVLQQNNDTADQVNGATVLAAGEWNHVALVSTGTAYALYVNGAAETLTVATGANTGDWLADTPNRDSVTLGVERNSGLAGYMNGSLRDVRYYSRALSADEILQIYRLGVPEAPVAWSRGGENAVDHTRTRRTITRAGGVVDGRCARFDGVDDTLALGNLGEIVQVSMWVRPYSDTEELFELSAGGNWVGVNGGVVTYTGLTAATTYVNGQATTALAAGVWSHLVCQFTAAAAGAFSLGAGGQGYGRFDAELVRVEATAWSADRVATEYIRDLAQGAGLLI